MKEITPNHTQIPNEYLDNYMAELSGAEWKCLSYLARRTFGFQKRADKISISQFQNGMKDKNGKQLDKGTGLSNRVVIASLKKLEKIGLITSTKKNGILGYYKVNINITYDEKSPVTKSHRGCDEKSQVPMTKSHIQKKGNKVIKRKIVETSVSVEKPFFLDEYIETMKQSKLAHVRLIGWYFKKAKSNFPDEKTISKEIARWSKDATFIVPYGNDKIIKTYEFVKTKFPNDWNLGTIRKYISQQ